MELRNGQAAGALVVHFQQVIATDASIEQVRQATMIEGLEFCCAPAEESSFANHSVDLVTVAQALHWFDLPAFADEVDRVLVGDGVLAVWTCGLVDLWTDAATR
ncbi:MAG: class I SAM-dependent methyltransferase [Gammaproteobacteria bacterium]|nr:class I SAM-dependent methyltransferase [Gammaproteobacteria bacterium]